MSEKRYVPMVYRGDRQILKLLITTREWRSEPQDTSTVTEGTDHAD